MHCTAHVLVEGHIAKAPPPVAEVGADDEDALRVAVVWQQCRYRRLGRRLVQVTYHDGHHCHRSGVRRGVDAVLGIGTGEGAGDRGYG